MRDDIADHLDEISDNANDFREVLKFDGDDWRALPKDLQDAINAAAMALSELEDVIGSHVENQ